ncbi:hypothetical protein ACVIWU_006580 [Bradyrhizobium sp. USDA 4509]
MKTQILGDIRVDSVAEYDRMAIDPDGCWKELHARALLNMSTGWVHVSWSRELES